MHQYPYRLFVLDIPDSLPDASGDYPDDADSADWSDVSDCRDEVNGAGSSVSLEDGSVQVYDALLQLPVSCPTLDAGTPVEVRDGAVVRVKGTIKRFTRGFLHCRAWV